MTESGKKREMPIMSSEEFQHRVNTHLYVFKNICKKADRFYFGIKPESLFNWYRLEFEQYFITTFAPDKGWYFTCAPDKTIRVLDKIYADIFACKDCMKQSEN